MNSKKILGLAAVILGGAFYSSTFVFAESFPHLFECEMNDYRQDLTEKSNLTEHAIIGVSEDLQTVEFSNSVEGKPVGKPTLLNGSGAMVSTGYRAYQSYSSPINQVRLRGSNFLLGAGQLDLYADVFVTYECQGMSLNQ